jgi:hypothetical protein
MPASPKSKTLTVSIDAPAKQVYDFAVNPENLPRWATAFVRSVKRVAGEWIIEAMDGTEVGVRFVPRNELGVLDHAVRLPSGQEITSHMRVIPNGSGSEVIFTLFQSPGMSDDDFARDAGMIQRDLQTLKGVLEA